MYSKLVYFYAYYVAWLLVGSEWNTPVAVHTVTPDDEQKSTRNM
jgi:hypothetical protein